LVHPASGSERFRCGIGGSFCAAGAAGVAGALAGFSVSGSAITVSALACPDNSS
jgi:hypothetical protein